MGQPSYESSTPTPTVPTSTVGAGSEDIVHAGHSNYMSDTDKWEGQANVVQPGTDHPAYGGNAGQGAMGYQGFQDGELGALGQ